MRNWVASVTIKKEMYDKICNALDALRIIVDKCKIDTAPKLIREPDKFYLLSGTEKFEITFDEYATIREYLG